MITLELGTGGTSLGYLLKDLTRNEALAVLDELRDSVAALPEHGTKPELAEKRKHKP